MAYGILNRYPLNIGYLSLIESNPERLMHALFHTHAWRVVFVSPTPYCSGPFVMGFLIHIMVWASWAYPNTIMAHLLWARI